MSQMRGVFPILVTPFDEQERVDVDSLQSGAAQAAGPARGRRQRGQGQEGAAAGRRAQGHHGTRRQQQQHGRCVSGKQEKETRRR